jgi:hypothetical protein
MPKVKVIIRAVSSHAPPITPAILTDYEALAERVAETDPRRLWMQRLCRMLRLFWETPESTLEGTPNPSENGTVIVPLEEAEKRRVFEAVPFPQELNVYAAEFNKWRNDHEDEKPFRDAAGHLVWYAREINNGREPITADKVPAKN